MIRDQRSMYVGPNLATVADVRVMWERLAGAVSEQRGDTVTLHETGETVHPWVEHGRWAARCDCGGGMAGWPDHEKVACLDCGSIYDAEYPSAETIADVVKVLRTRPKPTNWNWNPATETLADLQASNLIMADLPADYGGLVVDGKRVRDNELVASIVNVPLPARLQHALGSG